MSFEILSAEQLVQITGKKRKSAQVAWFKKNFGLEPVLRADGSILMTQSAFEALLLKRMGVADALTKPEAPRPPLLSPFKNR
ncbi:DUF4224 domain-containing protein [Paraburkholderia sp. Ac-20342]|uniref:DUF4224 domain-containing protein n=1 Tax=unclassified Paraburkholderia TaxID=2615204 RepID=UPI00141F2E39|nr:DUF4224 domain-containing protein [Paraburkholderia sp. Ac-20342]